MKSLALLLVLLTLVTYGQSQILATMGDEVRVVEGGPGTGNIMTFPVYLSEPVLTQSTVTFSVVAGTATSGVDYLVPLVTTVTFLPGSSQEVIRVPVFGDSTVEDTETFDVLLTAGTGVTVSFPFASRGYIVNDDGVGATLTAETSVREAFSYTAFTVTLATTAGVDVSFTYRAYSKDTDTATPGEDFDNEPVTLTIPAGSLTASGFISIYDDIISEGPETFTLEVYNANKFWFANSTNGAVELLSTTITIIDDDVLMSVSDASLSEGSGTNTNFVFTVSLTQPLETGQSAIVSLSLVHVTTVAADFTDISAVNSNLTFGAGDQSKTVTIVVFGDTIAESTETFELRATVVESNPVAFVQGGYRVIGIGTIVDDDAAITLAFTRSVSTSTIAENGGNIVFTVTPSGTNTAGPAGSYTVSVNSLTATNTLDFTTTLTTNDLLSGSQTISWAAGASPAVFTFTVAILQDSLAETDETFNVTLTNLNQASAPGVTSWIFTITDNTIVLSVGNATAVLEGQGGSATPNTLLFPITLNRASSSAYALTIEYDNTTDSMIARPGVDFSGPTTLTLAAGATSATLTVTIIGDSVVELDEWVIFAVTGVTPNAIISSNVGYGMIENDDTFIYVGDVTVSEGDVGVTSAIVRIYSPDPFPASATVTYFTPTSVGTATAGVDYLTAQSTISLPTGATETFVTISIVGDTTAEATETFTVEITSGTGGIGPGSPAFGTVTIVNDDGPSLTIADTSALESSGQLVFTLVLDAVPSSGASVQISTGNLVSATPVVDFTVVRNQTVTFAAGSTNATFTVTVIDDSVAEATETLTLTFASPNFIRVPSSLLPTGRIVNDDGIRVGFLNTNQYSLPEGDSGITNFLFVIGPTGSSTGINSAARVIVETIAQTASAGSDYVPITAQSVSIGATPVTVTVQVIGDTIAEPTETYQVRLYYPDYVFFSSPTTIDLTVQASILGDDWFANISSVSKLEGDLGDANTQFVFEILFTGAASLGSTLTYATSDVTAISSASSNNDYVAIPSTTVTIATGATSHLVTVTVIPDSTPEVNETFSLTLTGSYLLKLGTPTIGTGTIINDDYTLSIVDQSIFETDAAHTATFTFTIDGPAPAGATFRVQTTDGTALAGVNYAPIDNVVNLTTGVQAVNISVNIIGDTAPGPSVSFNLVFSQISRIILSSTTARVTIINDDGPQISVTAVSALEGNTTAQSLVFNVVADSAVTTAAAGFFIQTKKVTTTVGDFVEVSTAQFVNFTSGATTRAVTINTIPDLTIEDTETFELVITNPAFVKFSSGVTASGLTTVGTIINDDGLGITVPALFRVEGTSTNSTTPFVFTVNLVGGTAPNGTSIDFAIVPGTATTPSDYTTTSGIVNFVTGATFGSATVQVVADSVDEPQETFFLTLSNPNKVNIQGFTNATATISNDDAVVTITSASVLEGSAGTTAQLIFPVQLSSPAPPSPGQLSFLYTVTGGTATAGTDFVAVSSTFTFSAGTTQGTITVTVNGDNTAEPDETVILTISSITNGIIGTATVNGTILNDDMQLNVVNDFFYERDTRYPYRFPIYQTVASSTPATVTYSVTSVTAVAGRDFQLLSNLTLNLNSTDVITYVDFDILGDLVPQGDKFFQVTLTGCVGCVIGGSPSATVTLWEDDYSIAFSTSTYTVTETETTFNMTVSLVASQPLVTAGPNPQITVATSDVTAVAGSDYTSRTSTFTFQSGDSSATLTIPILGDTESEPTETFLVTLSNPVGLKIGTPGSAVVTIEDNDARLIRVSHPRIFEGGDARSYAHDVNINNLTFVVSLSGPATAGSVISYATEDGSARENSDYIPVSGTYAFIPGETSFSVPVQVIADYQQERSETVYLVVTDFDGALKTDEFTDGVGTIINDDYKGFGIHGVVRGQLRVNNREVQ